ncbi:MAG: hemerythrin domain-containing protein [Gallionellaceae bacterium]|jgi:hemerythrin-like domain-containing protein
MKSIVEFMTSDHKACDEQFVLAEHEALSNNWPEAEVAFHSFFQRMSHHFLMEEEVLFPALLAVGGPSGPVQMMTMEHAQMNSLLDQMATAVALKDNRSYSGLSETLLIVMQQHNLKEEQILYPLAQRMLASEWPSLHSRLLAF